MSDADKYLKELDRIAGKRKHDILRSEYKKVQSFGYESMVKKFNDYMDMKDDDARKYEPEIRAAARDLMERGMGSGEQGLLPNVTAALRGAALYEKIGKGRKAIPKLLKAAEKDKNGAISQYKGIREFIERNAGGRQKASSGIESRVSVFIAFLLGGIVLSLTSLRATGSAIGNLTGTSQGLLGIFLFIFGLTGIFFGLKK